MKILTSFLLFCLMMFSLGFDGPASDPAAVASQNEQMVLDTIAQFRSLEQRDVIYNEEGGEFLIEAENFSARGTSGISGGWWEVDADDDTFTEGPVKGQVALNAPQGASGNYMEAVGKNIGDIMPTSPYYHGPFLDYRINVTRPGRYLLRIKWTGADGSTDSVYAYFLNPDGTLLAHQGPAFFLFHGIQRGWRWDSAGLNDRIRCAYAGRPDTAGRNIPEAGVYTLRLSLREKGTAVDEISLRPEPQKDIFECDPGATGGCRGCRSSFSTETWGAGAGFDNPEEKKPLPIKDAW